jgi:hypothetical protein
VGDSRYFMVNPPNSSLLKETIPDQTETQQVIPSKQFLEENGAQTYNAKPGGPEMDSNNRRMEANTAGASNVLPEHSVEKGSPKEMAPATTKPVDTVPSNLKQKAPVMVALTEKTPDNIQASVQMPSKIQPTSPSAASASSVIDKKKPVIIPASKTKQDEIQMPDSKPVSVQSKPKTPETKKTGTVIPVEKPETGKSITKPDQIQEKTSERYQAGSEIQTKKEPESPKNTEVEKGAPVASAVFPEKQATTLAAIPLVNPPKETVISKKDLPGEDNIVSREKAQLTPSVSDEKKAVNRVEEKVVSLSVPARKSETVGRAGFADYNLHVRLKAFLNDYCRTYEQKDLNKFSTFFALNAVEKGKPFRFWLSKYRQNFNRIDSMEYNIELERYATQEETGLFKIDGLFHVRAKLGGSKEWLKNSGQISMILQADGNSFKVVQLDY